ncbi:heterokaryon incompatibility protein-domain-containing protein [Armillaria novae-zelandiae]|uniref:Heterokaryon incompatibility protein-domain-containing protein n=1 Tax=Armillaria novae-zelandiae TaxID=153914 RepID=A0AA39UEN0_9AGAR|nr:heterokaryon incompatibility protein-domain-containing protein [Armillaria novae-zelandiae]
MASHTSIGCTMEIYLVRVRERLDKTLWIERKPRATTDDSYIAISHVWGEPETIKETHIDGMGTVSLSPGKKDILSILQRQDICGDGWFWMDLFCIDQNPDAAISISDQLMAIPQIYKSSQCVKILLESPVCNNWHVKASSISANPDIDMDLFNEEELRHCRKCPNMVFHDPWFKRLWTRQEGLYAMKMQVILLNPISCARYAVSLSDSQKYLTEGDSIQKRGIVESFLADKLAYHGLLEGKELSFRLYLDLLYRHRVAIDEYHGEVGPHPSYSPIKEAWRSGRKTTKARDYVLAVFPDITGYRPPPNVRRLKFRELLSDALQQFMTRSQQVHILAKVPRGMMTTTAMTSPFTDSASPWIPEEPTNISEAFDTFSGDNSPGQGDTKFYLVSHAITFEPVDFSREALPDLINLWESTANTIGHAVLLAPSGPCAGGSRDVRTEEGLLHRYFVHQFMRHPISKHSSKAEFEAAIPVGIVDIDRLSVVNPEFSRELKQFLVCLMCGTTLRTADVLLEAIDFRLIPTAYGRLCALVNKHFLSSANPEDFVLVTTMSWMHQGLLVAAKTSDSYHIVGRTLIPTMRFWDYVQVNSMND